MSDKLDPREFRRLRSVIVLSGFRSGGRRSDTCLE
jgi:hypothetical protein